MKSLNRSSTENITLPSMQCSRNSNKVAIFIRSLTGAGAERVVINLIHGMVQQGILPDLLLTSEQGSFLSQVPSGVRVINLNTRMVIQSALPLAEYLRHEKPDILLSHLHSNNVTAVIAKQIAQSSTKLFLVEHGTFSRERHKLKLYGKLLLPRVMRWAYPQADLIIAVSKGAARDLETELSLKPGSVTTIYNPVVDTSLLEKSKSDVEHPWFQPDQISKIPVFLSVGRLSKEKNHRNLIQAFAQVRAQKPARLVILGEGKLRQELETLIQELELMSDVWMPGFVENPYAYMSRASAFILSSDYEALPTVLIEAIACSCPVISTNCPNGPAEILEQGRYGLLVPANDPEALANAMRQTLELSIDRELLTQRAQQFNIEAIVSQYLQTMGLFQ